MLFSVRGYNQCKLKIFGVLLSIDIAVSIRRLKEEQSGGSVYYFGGQSTVPPLL